MPSITTDNKEELLSKSELSIWLDRYDDIFSDFDSRPYAERALSDDFINEAKKMMKEKTTGKMKLKLLMPASQRVQTSEEVIIKNLHTQFRHFAHSIEKEMKQSSKRGFIFTIVGFILMGTASYIISLRETSLVLSTLRVLLEPSGWFLVWTGLDHIFYISKKRKSELNFNSKMAHAEIEFLSF